jgi:hypothetical protein
MVTAWSPCVLDTEVRRLGSSGHCFDLMGRCSCVVCAGLLLCLLRDVLPKKAAGFVPSPMAMGIPFYIGASSVSAHATLMHHST